MVGCSVVIVAGRPPDGQEVIEALEELRPDHVVIGPGECYWHAVWWCDGAGVPYTLVRDEKGEWANEGTTAVIETARAFGTPRLLWWYGGEETSRMIEAAARAGIESIAAAVRPVVSDLRGGVR